MEERNEKIMAILLTHKIGKVARTRLHILAK